MLFPNFRALELKSIPTPPMLEMTGFFLADSVNMIFLVLVHYGKICVPVRI